jgi:ATP-dependent Clp protease ATP-binding subunit ClpA
MAGLKAGLKAVLKQLKVRIDKPDDDTMLLRNVPADSRCFSKPQTNVLVKRPRAGLPFLVCVDEDLDYVGPDRDLARVFAMADRRQGWRVVSAGSAAVFSQAEDAVQQALAMLGASGEGTTAAKAPSARPAGAGLLARFAVNITAPVRAGAAPQTVGREEAAEQAAASLLCWQRRLPLIAGAPGLGKTNILYKVAGHLAEVRPDWELLSVDLCCLLAGVLWDGEREKLLNAVLEEAVAGGAVVLALERLELAVMTVPLTPWLLAAALDSGARLAATCLPPFAEKLAAGPLARRLDPIEVTELAREDAAIVLGQIRETLAAHHRVAIDAPVVEAAVMRSLSLAGRLPDKAITLLDAAAARAALLKQPEVALCDVYLAASRMKDA